MVFRAMTENGVLFPEPLATETVPMDQLKPGDTVLDHNLHGLPVYRVVQSSKLDDLNQGRFWLVSYHRERDVPGPGIEFMPTISAGGIGAAPDRPFERVTELPEGRVMCRASKFQELDWVEGLSRDEHHVVWQTAKQVDSKENVLVRFARDDDFMRMRELGRDVYLVRPHRWYR